MSGVSVSPYKTTVASTCGATADATTGVQQPET